MATYHSEAVVYKRQFHDSKNSLIIAFTDRGKKALTVSNPVLKKSYLTAYAHVRMMVSERNGRDRIYESEVIDSFKSLASSIEKMKMI